MMYNSTLSIHPVSSSSEHAYLDFISGDYGEFLSIQENLPGRKKWIVRNRLWLATSLDNIAWLQENIPNLKWHSELKDHIERLAAQIEEEKRLRELKKSVSLPEEAFSFPYKTQPFDHQRKAFFMSRDLEYYGLMMEMGTGKTKVIIDTAAYLWGKGEINALLIVAPNGVHRQWILEQIPQHMPDWVDYKAAYYRSGAKAKELAQYNDARNYEGLRILAFNVESLASQTGVSSIESFLYANDVLWAFDESHKIKNYSATRTKISLKLAKYAKYRRIATGTPVSQGVQDLFPQLSFLSKDILGMDNFTAYKNRYCVMGGFEGRQIIGFRNQEELQKKIEAYSFRVKKEDCLDLPEKIYVDRIVELHPEQRRCYDSMADELLVQLPDGGLISADIALTKLLRLHQIVTGHLPIIDEETNKTIGFVTVPEKGTNPRVEACLELIEQAEGSVIVWAVFRHDTKALSEALTKAKISFVTYNGDTPEKDRQQNIEKFRNGEAKVFIGQQASAGTGLNLTVANTVIYYSNDFSAEKRWQSEDRTHRIGQKHNVTYIDLVAPNTIDRSIHSALRKKKKTADILVDGGGTQMWTKEDIQSIIQGLE